ncbi:MAG: DUF6438 domain-containing protein [Bacteroidota bacterium]
MDWKKFEYLSVNDSLVSIELRTFKDDFKYQIKDNQLILKNSYEISTRNKEKASKVADSTHLPQISWVRDSTLYYFDFNLINNDSLELKLEKIIGRNLSSPKEQYNYNRKSSLKEKKINFKSVFFKGTTCFGTCPKMKIEIDSLGNAKFKGEQFTKPFIGNFKGKLTSDQLESLVEILNRSELDRIPKSLPVMIDAPNYKFIFNYDNKKREISGSILPYFNWELASYLLKIYKEIKWKEVEYEIEFNE